MSTGKEEKFRRVEASALELLAGSQRGLSVSLLARKAGVSRPWIYKHFGKDREELLAAAAKAVGERFAELDHRGRPRSPEDLRAFFEAGAEKTLRDVEEQPWIPGIYFRFVGAEGPLGEVIRAIRGRYVRKAVDLQCRCGIPRATALASALASAKLRMAVAHAWAHEKEMRQAGQKAAVSEMMSVFRW